MDTEHARLWCALLGQRVEVTLRRAPRAQTIPGVPQGWTVETCLDRDTACYGTGCPLTTDAAGSPFGDVEAPPEGAAGRPEPGAQAPCGGEPG